MLEVIICSSIGVVTIILSVVLLLGRGSFLIAGYNTMPKEEKEKYNAPALCKFIGKILLPIGLLIILAGFNEFIPNANWLWVILGVAIVGITVFSLVFANTKNRFKK